MVHAVRVDRDRAADREDVGGLHRLDGEPRMQAVWMSCQVAPLWTVTTAARSSSDMRLKPRHVEHDGVAREGVAAHAVAHAGDRHLAGRARAQTRAPLRTSSTSRTSTTPWTGVRFRQLASLTVPPRCDQGSAPASASAPRSGRRRRPPRGSVGGQSFGRPVRRRARRRAERDRWPAASQPRRARTQAPSPSAGAGAGRQ